MASAIADDMVSITNERLAPHARETPRAPMSLPVMSRPTSPPPPETAVSPSAGTNPADPSTELAVIVGRNLRRLRTRRGLSLERLARLSLVSRAMLGQIENGKSTPTIAVLWKVANALDVPFTTLVAIEETPGAIVLRREKARTLESSEGRFSLRALFPFEDERCIEFYELRISPLHIEYSEPHALNTLENIVVARGTVEITAGGDKGQVLSEGDSIVFKADAPHSYHNLGTTEAVLYLVMTCQGRGTG